MNFIPCVSWIPRGVSKEVPDEIKLEKEDLERILNATAEDLEGSKTPNNESDEGNDDTPKEKENVEEDDDDDMSFIDKYDLDNYDDEIDEANNAETFASLKTVACYASNEDDPYITIKEDESDEDEEDNKRIRSTDNLIAVGHVDQDASILEFRVYNEEEGHLYVHHDILLPSYPLCIEWLDFDPDEDSPGNFIAVGSMLPQIDVWDVDIINSLEPSFSLGEKKRKKNKSANKKVKREGHSDAVLALSWNKLIKNGLASGSADHTALLWDLKTQKSASKIKHHKEKVQTLQFHPFEAQTLLSGSCDKTAKLFDCRDTSKGCKSWSFDAEVEKVVWNYFDPYHFIVGTESGYFHYMDVRSEVPVYGVQAHSEAIAGLSLSSHCPGCLITVSTDRYFKVWDIMDKQAECVLEHDFRLGQMYCLSSCPDNAFVIAAGGDNKENNFVVWDIRQFNSVVERFGTRQLLKVDPTSNLKKDAADQMDVEDNSSFKFSENGT